MAIGTKSKTSRRKKNTRRSHDFLSPPTPGTCPNCGALKQAHHVCLSCGHYKGREVVAARQ